MRTMKRTFLLFLLSALLLPLGGLAQNKPKIKSVDLVIPVPEPGMSLFDARELQFTAAKTEYGDLAASGGIRVQQLDWLGDFRETDGGGMFFKDGFTYKAQIQFMIDPSGKYATDYIFKNNNYYIDGTRISATVNGQKATVKQSAPYFINIEVSIPVGTGGKGSERDLTQSKPTDYELNKDSYRASMKAYSLSEADDASPETNPLDVITINDKYHPRFLANWRSEYNGQKNMRVTKIIVDTGDEKIYGGVAADVNNSVQGTYNIREVWISDKVDATKFIRNICMAMRGEWDYDAYYAYHSYMFQTQRATLFIPEAAAGKVREMLSRPTWSYATLFSLKTYAGDVYSAQKAGADAAKPFCTKHEFTAKMAAADKVVRYATCRHWTEYYYSCKYCGQSEHNAAHTFTQLHSKYEKTPVSQYSMPSADDQAYVGVNAAGQHVWWYSCLWCGHSQGYDQKHVSKAEWQATGNAASYEVYRKAMADAAKLYEEEALLKTTAQVGMFILKDKSDAKMSPAYQSSVNYALNDNLLDDSVLGKDYTVTLNHAQLLSLATRLVEELTGKTTPASVIGINSVMGKAVSDNAPATRQEAAAVMYRALRFIEESRLYSYTEFTSGLDKYSDSGNIAPWAKEAMAFMEALGLLKGTSDSTIAPEKTLSIEEAIDLTQKCTHAHQLGWYQARSWGEGKGRDYDGYVLLTPSTVNTRHTIAPGERIWVTGPRLGEVSGHLPTIDSYTGQPVYVKAEWFRPVRKFVYESERTITGPIIFQDYFYGVSTKAQ